MLDSVIKRRAYQRSNMKPVAARYLKGTLASAVTAILMTAHACVFRSNPPPIPFPNRPPEML